MSSKEKVDEIPVRKPSAKKATAKKKRSRGVFSLAEKYKVVKAINSGKPQAEVALLFDLLLSQSTVATIERSKKEIISAHEGGLYKDKCKRMKQPSYPVSTIVPYLSLFLHNELRKLTTLQLKHTLTTRPRSVTIKTQ